MLPRCPKTLSSCPLSTYSLPLMCARLEQYIREKYFIQLFLCRDEVKLKVKRL